MKAFLFFDLLINQLLQEVKINMKIGLMIAFAKHMIAHGPDFDLKEGVSVDGRRISSREMFWYLLDLELKRGMRYQNYFCLLTFKLCRIHDHANGKGLQTCY
jgi:hypothetical protein